MNRIEQSDITFALLQSALIGERIDDEKFADLNSSDWDSLLHFGMHHKVAALMCDGIVNLKIHKPATAVWRRFCAEQTRVEDRFNHQQKSLVELLQFFNPKGVRTMVLKGSLLAACYPSPQHRSFSDLDIYQFGRFREADQLISFQFGIKVGNAAHHHTKYAFHGVTIENHYDFVNIHTPWSNRSFERILKSLDKDAREISLAGQSVYIPSATFEALFLIRHSATHFATGQLCIRDLCDWRMFLQRKSSQVAWDYVTDIYGKYGLMPYVGAIQAILEDHLSLEPIAELPRSTDEALIARVLNDILYGEFSESEHPEENLSRAFWKLRRRRANRWKHSIVYRDSWASIQFSSLIAHLIKPRSILHKV